jgi:ABC-type multidrug transport system fused ATPase/permease subunit
VAVSLAQRWYSARIGEGLIYDLRTQVFDHVQRLPVAFFLRIRTGDLISRLNSDIIAAQRALTNTLSGVSTAMYQQFFLASLVLLTSPATATVYGVGGVLSVRGAFPLGTLVALAALLIRLYGPLTTLSNIQVDMMTALVSFDRLLEILDLKPMIEDRPGSVPLPCTASPAIDFDDVTFRYPPASQVTLPSLAPIARTDPTPERDVLHGVSFRAAPGTVTALVGPSGAGKTTITQLISRLYDVSAGRVRVGGHDVREVTQASLRAAIGVVPQDPHVFHDSIRANLGYARPDASERDIIAALRSAQLWDLVRTLPEGLDTMVGDRGYRLSGGEKQRLAIARLLLKAPAIVILDEATAHLDSESEAAVQQAMKTALSGRTSIVIAHRLSTIQEADQILVIDDGRVVQRGRHASLLAAGGLYGELYRTQYARHADADAGDRVSPRPGRRGPGARGGRHLTGRRDRVRTFSCKLTAYGLPQHKAYIIRIIIKGDVDMADGRPDDGTSAAQPAIELSGLTKRYRRGKGWFTAVDDVTLSVPHGQVIGLLGPNGAGKTTTIKMACGLIVPTAGTIRLNGYDVERRRADAVRQIGAVLEGSRNVYWPLAAWQNLMYFGKLKGLRAAEIKPRAGRLLTDLGLWDRRGETVGSYSRGMQQKVAIAAALITDPPILLLDEPTIGLDVEAARTVKDWIAHLAADEGKTIVLTTHQLAIVQELADRIAVIRDGEIIADLPTGELLSRFAEDRFEVRAAGQLAGLARPLPAGARAEADADTTRVVLQDADQGRLQEFLEDLRASGVPLLSVTQAQPDLEEIFLKLVGTPAGTWSASGGHGTQEERAGVSR